MKKKLLKTLLLAVGLLVGGNAWGDPIETIGSLSSGWWTDFSSTYTLEGYGKYHFQFTTTNANDGNVYKTWLLVATNGNDSHGGGGTEYFVWRGEGYAWGQETNSNDTPDKLACSNTYSTANPTGAGIQAAMNGAAVDMVITRESTNIYATATVTPMNGENEFTMSFSYLYGNATSSNIGLFFTVEKAQVILNTAEQTASWSTIWNTDFSSAPSGMTYSISAGSCNINNGYLWYKNDAGSGNRTQTASFTDSKFNIDTNWIMEFDWNCGQSNGNASDVTFATNNGNAFTLGWKNNGNGQVTVTDASSTTLTTTLPVAGYNIGSISTWSHVVVKGDKDNGVYLTITNGATTYVNNAPITSTYGYPVSFNGTLGKSVSAMGIDNIVFRTPAVAGYVDAPTYTITGAYNTDRKFTLACLTPNVTIYYAASDLDKGDAGWNVYSSEVTTSDATIYAYAEDEKGNTSDKINFATGVGTTVKLAGATVTHSGNGQYTITNSQSGVLGTPPATVHYQIDGGSELTSTSTSIVVNVVKDGTLTYWLTADGYGSVDSKDEAIYSPRAYAVTRTIDFKTSNDNTWAVKGDEVSVDGDSHTYYKYKDQSENILADGLLATTFNGNDGTSWRIQRYYGGTKPYAATEYVALKSLKAGQLVQFESSSAPTIVSNLTVVPASSYTGTYTYTATADGDVIVSMGTSVTLRTIKLCEATISVDITAAGFATYANHEYALDFSSISGLKAFTASLVDESTVHFATADQVPAGTGLLLKGEEDSYNVPVISSAAAIADNLLCAPKTAITGNSLVYDDETYYNYILSEVSGKIGFYKANNSNVAVGKAYLHIPKAQLGRQLTFIGFDFDDEEVTGVNDVRRKKEEGISSIYNLNGQRVNAPKKGLFIMNGKKVIVR